MRPTVTFASNGACGAPERFDTCAQRESMRTAGLCLKSGPFLLHDQSIDLMGNSGKASWFAKMGRLRAHGTLLVTASFIN